MFRRRRPTLTAVVAIAAALGVLVAWLYAEMESADARVNHALVVQTSVVSIRNRTNRAIATTLSETFTGKHDGRFDAGADHRLAREELERLRTQASSGPRLAWLAARLQDQLARNQAIEHEIHVLGAAGRTDEAARVLGSARWMEARGAAHETIEELLGEATQEWRRLDHAHTVLFRTMAAAIGVLVLFLLSTLVLSVLLSRRERREREESAARLAVASRLAALGTLVAGVAHEINNPLAAAISSHGFAADELGALLGRLRSRTPPDPAEVGRRLDQILEALSDSQVGQRRVAAIVQDLVTFGRAGSRREQVRLRDVVEGARRWVPAPCAGRIRIEVDDRHASDVLASPGQLQQVLVHLVSNACKAIPPGRTGRVIIRLQPGPPGFSRIEVVDDGVGMAPEVLARVFDPFFTTREVGQGMGLGLSLSHVIVEGFGGALTATSAPGAGTVMRVDLPVAA